MVGLLSHQYVSMLGTSSGKGTLHRQWLSRQGLGAFDESLLVLKPWTKYLAIAGGFWAFQYLFHDAGII